MDKITHNLNIDITEHCEQKIIRIKRGDTECHKFIVKITSEKEPVDLTGCQLKLYALKPDDKIVFQNFEPVDEKQGIFEIDLTSQLSETDGIVKCEITIYKSSATLATAIWLIYVDYTLRDDEAIESSNEFSALTEALAKAETANTAIDNCIAAAERANTAAENVKDGEPGPQGPPGIQGPPGENGKDGLTVSVNEKSPDSNGNISLSAEDVGTLSSEEITETFAPSIADTASNTLPIVISDIAKNTKFKEMRICGNTMEVLPSGTKSPINKSTFQDISQTLNLTCGEQVQAITLPQSMYRINNDICDSLTHTGTLTSCIKKLVLKGTETWVHYKNNGNYVCFYLRDSNLKAKPLSGNGTGLCNIANWKPWITSSATESGICTTSTDNIIFFNLPRADIGNDPAKTTQEQVDDFKAWLAAQYAAGTPVIVYYQLATPVTTQATCFSLPVPTYPATTITTTDAVPAWVSVDYYRDTKSYIDSKFAQLSAAIISLGGNINV